MLSLFLYNKSPEIVIKLIVRTSLRLNGAVIIIVKGLLSKYWLVAIYSSL